MELDLNWKQKVKLIREFEDSLIRGWNYYNWSAHFEHRSLTYPQITVVREKDLKFN